MGAPRIYKRQKRDEADESKQMLNWVKRSAHHCRPITVEEGRGKHHSDQSPHPTSETATDDKLFTVYRRFYLQKQTICEIRC